MAGTLVSDPHLITSLTPPTLDLSRVRLTENTCEGVQGF